MSQRFDQIPKAESGSGPSVRSSAAVLRLKFIALFGSLVFAAVCGIAAIAITLANQSEAPLELPEEPYATGFATIAADDFLQARCTNVPVADKLDPCFGVTSSTPPESDDDDDDEDEEEDGDAQPFDPDVLPVGAVSVDANGTEALPVLSWTWTHFERSYLPDFDVHYETHHFLVVTGPDTPGDDAVARRTDQVTTKLFDLAVTVTLTESGPVLSAAPSLVPVPPRSTTVPKLDWTAYETVIPDPVRARVEEWADAYAADDSTAMAAIADDTAGGTYLGLGDATVTGVDFTGGAISGANDDLVIRARVSFKRANGFSWTTEFDLLVQQAGSAQPKVVAWGPPGSAMTLRAYMNSVESR